jgi:hypothetical protein
LSIGIVILSMDKLKEKLHIGKSREERANELAGGSGEQGMTQ